MKKTARKGQKENWTGRLMGLAFAASFFASGLFHEAEACIFGGLFGLLFLLMAAAEGRVRFHASAASLCTVLVVLSYLLSALWGVDAGMGWIGFQKMLAVLFFLCCIMQLDGEGRERLLGIVPHAGALMVLIGILSRVTGLGYGLFFTADRFGGFFQYANVFALFCLCGMLLLAGGTGALPAKWLPAGEALLLFAGILMSGSRTVFFLALTSVAVLAIRERRFRLPAALLLCAVCLAAAYAALTGDVQNVGRFLTSSLHSSTFLGRLLYAKDGLGLLAGHPFGLGYLGYWFLEPSVQTGVYSVRFVHNDLLQMALDIGVVPALLFAAAFVREVFRRGRVLERRLLLAVLGLHCLVDFDLEFTSVWFLLLLVLDPCHGRELSATAGPKALACKILAGTLSLTALYTGIAMLPRRFGDSAGSVSLLPFYTEAAREVLARETDPEAAEELAEGILDQNPHIPEAYDILAVTAYQRGDYLEMAAYKKKSVGLQKYNTDAYNRYVILLSSAAEAAASEGDGDTALALLREAAEVDDMVDAVREATDPLAYEIRDVPDFELSAEVREYVAQAEALLAE